MSFREVKAVARSRIHDRLRVESYLYSDGPEGDRKSVFLRINSNVEAVGGLVGSSGTYAENLETIPKLIFLADEHRPKRGEVYVIGAEEAYRIDSTEPLDLLTIAANARRLSKEESARYEYPGC